MVGESVALLRFFCFLTVSEYLLFVVCVEKIRKNVVKCLEKSIFLFTFVADNFFNERKTIYVKKNIRSTGSENTTC